MASTFMDLIRNRRSVFPPAFSEEPVDREIIEHCLEAARWAPTHRRTEPWRFRVYSGAALADLAGLMADLYARHTPAESYSEGKHEKVRRNILRSAAVILIILQRDPMERVPEWEEIAALAASVENLWLAVTDAGLGGYWSTPGFLKGLSDRLGLSEGQRCMGIFYLGRIAVPPGPGERQPLENVVTWVEAPFRD